MTNRNTGIELLRIICMLLIVSGHSISHGNYSDFPFSINGIFALSLSQGARIGVDCFVLITGYFSSRTKIQMHKMRNLYIQVITYSILISALMFLMGEISISKDSILHTFLPFSSSQYWFATCYLMLLIFVPVLRIFAEHADKRVFLTIIIILTILWSVLSTIRLNSPAYSSFVWFIYLFLLGQYLRLYPAGVLSKIKVYHGVLCLLIIRGLTVATYFAGKNILYIKENAVFFFGEMEKLPALFCAVLLFFGLKNCKLPQNRFISIIAPCVFGVYLLHDNPYIRNLIWNKIFCNSQNINEPYFIPMLVLSILIVFSVGIVIEFLRQKIMSLFMKR